MYHIAQYKVYDWDWTAASEELEVLGVSEELAEVEGWSVLLDELEVAEDSVELAEAAVLESVELEPFIISGSGDKSDNGAGVNSSNSPLSCLKVRPMGAGLYANAVVLVIP